MSQKKNIHSGKRDCYQNVVISGKVYQIEIQIIKVINSNTSINIQKQKGYIRNVEEEGDKDDDDDEKKEQNASYAEFWKAKIRWFTNEPIGIFYITKESTITSMP